MMVGERTHYPAPETSARLRLFLPRRERDDIAREISEEIREEMGDREVTLGRRLSVDEQAEMIGRYGHPLLTATRYRRQQHLIGPIVFPYYRVALTVVLSLMLFGHAVSLAVVVSGDPSWMAVRYALEDTVQNVFAVVASFTLLAVAADWWLAKTNALQRWDPRTLVPQAQAASRAPRPVDVFRRRQTYAWRKATTMCKFPATGLGRIAAVVLSAWWLLALKYPVLMFGPAAARLEWGPDMHRLYPLLVATTGLFLFDQVVQASPRQRWLLQVTYWVGPLLGTLFMLGVASSANHWVVWSGRASPVTIAVGTVNLPLLDVVNRASGLPFGVAGVVSALSLTWRLLRWLGSAIPANL